MTKLKLNFGNEDLAMARRVAWLLSGRDASTEADCIEDEAAYAILVNAIPIDPDADRKVTFLVRFGLDRWQDAQLADPRMAREVVAKRGAEHCPRLVADIEALDLRNQALEPLHRALSALEEAEALLLRADQVIAESRKANGAQSIGSPPTPHALVQNTLRALTATIRQTGNASRGGLHGRAKRERAGAINEWLRRLVEVGVTFNEVAFIIGAHPDECVYDASGWDAAHKRIRQARKADAAARWETEISGAENLHYAGAAMDSPSVHEATPTEPTPGRDTSGASS